MTDPPLPVARLIRASEGQTELVLVVNWFEELKGRVPK